MITRRESAADARRGRARFALLIATLAGCSQFARVGLLDSQDGGAPDDHVAPDEAVGDAGEEAPRGDPMSIEECGATNAAGLSSAQISALRAGGTLPAGARLLYPYDGTVFPSGLAAPLLMWEGVAPQAVLLAARSERLSYEGCFVPRAPGQLSVPDTLWKAAERAGTNADDPLEIAFTLLEQGKVRGPLRVSLVLSAQPMQGTLYYASYGSPSAGANNIAAVMRLPLGGTAAPFVAPAGTCAGCHAASADGSTVLLANSGMGQSYRPAPSSSAPPQPTSSMLSGVEYAAVDPSGMFYVAGSMSTGTGPRRMAPGPASAALLSLGGLSVPADTGLPGAALTPQFSPDGRWLAFNDMTDSAGHELAALSFSSQRLAFTQRRVLYSHASLFPAWPSFRPDNQQLVFALGERADFGANGTLLIAGRAAPGPASDLHLTDLTGATSTMLYRAMGFTSAEATRDEDSYLPFGAEDLHQNYYPSVLPRAAEDYDWVFFDSVRHYGDQGIKRGLWCAALDVKPGSSPDRDPSHPAFFVPGQELGPPNLRPVAVRALGATSDAK